MKLKVSMLAVATAYAMVIAEPAAAHGLVGRRDLPIPGWLFGWGAATVLAVSFLAFALLWQRPRLETDRPTDRARMPTGLTVIAGAVGIAVWLGLIYAGYSGEQSPTENIVPTFVYVCFWVLLPVLSMLFGDLFSAFNPWRAIGRTLGWTTSKAFGEHLPPPFEYPQWLGRWPAFILLVGFGVIELVLTNGQDPSFLAASMTLYGAVQLIGMSLFGVDKWCERGDAFGIYFGMFARMSVFMVAGGRIATRLPLAGLTEITWLPATVPFLCAAIGITAFDGASEGGLWQPVATDIQQFFSDLGLGLAHSLEAAYLVGLLLMIATVYGFYRLGVTGMRFSRVEMPTARLAAAFAPSLVPIALAYVIAHYFSFVVLQGQGLWSLVSDPLGRGSDYFGTADSGIDFGAVSASAVWYVQVIVLILGHAAGLAIAHDKALALWGRATDAVRSQVWMLVVMIGFTNLGLWLLSQQG